MEVGASPDRIARRPTPDTLPRMSYDLAVFDLAAAPSTHKAFVKWFEQQMEIEVLTPDDEAIATGPAPLRNWFTEMIKTFPPMNGPFASDDVDDPRLTEYSIAPSYIYACFAWSQVVPATEAAAEFAARFGAGLYLISETPAPVWLPDGRGDLKLMRPD